MHHYKYFFGALILLFTCAFLPNQNNQKGQFYSYTINPQTETIKMYWQNDDGENFGSLQQLKFHLEKEKTTLKFACNGGMYLKDGSPQGWYVENGIELKPMDYRTNEYGNFYMQPNGVFFIDEQNKAHILPHAKFNSINEFKVRFATQSGPMLLLHQEVNDKFMVNSNSTYVRNGVGIKPNGEVVFVQSKNQVNLYAFASYFLELGCSDALYLDGFVSRMYAPSSGIEQLDGNFGVIITITD